MCRPGSGWAEVGMEECQEKNGVEDEKPQNREFIPGRGMIQKVLYKGLEHRSFHAVDVPFMCSEIAENLERGTPQ